MRDDDNATLPRALSFTKFPPHADAEAPAFYPMNNIYAVIIGLRFS